MRDDIPRIEQLRDTNVRWDNFMCLAMLFMGVAFHLNAWPYAAGLCIGVSIGWSFAAGLYHG